MFHPTVCTFVTGRSKAILCLALYQPPTPAPNKTRGKEVGWRTVRSFQTPFNCGLFLSATSNQHKDLRSWQRFSPLELLSGRTGPPWEPTAGTEGEWPLSHPLATSPPPSGFPAGEAKRTGTQPEKPPQSQTTEPRVQPNSCTVCRAPGETTPWGNIKALVLPGPSQVPQDTFTWTKRNKTQCREDPWDS